MAIFRNSLHIIDAVIDSSKKTCVNILKRKRFTPLYIENDSNLKEKLNSGRNADGDVIMQKMRTVLEQMPVTRSKDQIAFHEEMLRACAAGIYGKSFDLQYKRILRQNGWKTGQKQALFSTPRRFGKTYCTAMFVVAYLLCVPNRVQVIYSPAFRTSSMFLDLVYAFLLPFVDTKKICKATTEAIWIYTEDGSTSKVFSYPSNPKIYHV